MSQITELPSPSGTSPLDTIKSARKDTGKVEKEAPAAWRSFVSGGFGGVCLVLVGHPLDLVKVRLQAGVHQYNSMAHAIRSIIRTDGPSGLYRGMTAPLLGVTPIFAVSFWSYALGQQIARHWSSGPSSNSPLSLGQIAFAGGFSALPTTILMTPFERIKVILQVQDAANPSGSGVKYRGPAHLVSSLIKRDGVFQTVKNLYRGTVATILRDSPGSVAYFTVYEVLKRSFTKPSPSSASPSSSSRDLPVGAVLLSGGLAGMANWIVAIPADVIKSRLQAGSEGSGLTVLKGLLREQGPRALFKGLGPALVRAFPANAACFCGVELSMRLMQKISEE